MYRLVDVGVSASSEPLGVPPVLSRLHVGAFAVVAVLLVSSFATNDITLATGNVPLFVIGVVVVVVVVVAEVVARVWSSLWLLWLLWSSFACACSCGCSGVVVAVAVVLLATSVEAPVPPGRGGVSSSVTLHPFLPIQGASQSRCPQCGGPMGAE